MRSVAVASPRLTTTVEVGGHRITVDEPERLGGQDLGPSPLELIVAGVASCVAITLQMYAKRHEWELGEVEVEVELSSTHDDEPDAFGVVVRLPRGISQDQVRRLMRVAGRCPVRTRLEHPSRFHEIHEPSTRRVPEPAISCEGEQGPPASAAQRMQSNTTRGVRDA